MLYAAPTEESVLSARPLELLPLWSKFLIGGRSGDCDAASAAGLIAVGLSPTGFRLIVAAAGTAGISSTGGMLGRRFLCDGVFCRPRMGDSATSLGSDTSATECRLL